MGMNKCTSIAIINVISTLCILLVLVLCAIELFNVVNCHYSWMKYIIVALLGIAFSLNTANSFLCVKDMKQTGRSFISDTQPLHGRVDAISEKIKRRTEDDHYILKGDDAY